MHMDLRKERERVENKKIAYILNFFPALSETFILGEIQNLLDNDIVIQLYALFRTPLDPNLKKLSLFDKTWFLSDHFKVMTLVKTHFYMMIHRPGGYWRTLFFALKLGFSFSLLHLPFTLLKMRRHGRHTIDKKDRQNIFLHFLLVMPMAKTLLDHKPGHIHAHYMNASVSMALLVSRLCGIRYSVSVHATDIFVAPEFAQQKLKNAGFIITCTQYNKKYITDVYPAVDPDKIVVNYHGVDVKKFQPGTNDKSPPVLLSVGRLVPKKGFRSLIFACQSLKQNRTPFHCYIIGEGKERASLELLARVKQVNDKITFTGAVSPDEIQNYYRQAHIFVLPCVIDQNGDRDGIPNVIAEAMAMARPVVSTIVSGIPELVLSGETGILVEPGDVRALQQALTTLLDSPQTARKMGQNGRERVEEMFDRREKTKELIDIFKQKVYKDNAGTQSVLRGGKC